MVIDEIPPPKNVLIGFLIQTLKGGALVDVLCEIVC